MNMQIQKRFWGSKNYTAHDFNDFSWKRNKLEFINIFDENCNILNATFIPNEFRGMDRFEARNKVIQKLKK